MAKMGEGKYFYYLPHSYNQSGFKIIQRDEHPNKMVIVETVNQDYASLIVDALNGYFGPQIQYNKDYVVEYCKRISDAVDENGKT